MKYILRSLLLYLALCQMSIASVTLNELEKCNKIAVAMLDACLVENTAMPDECWTKSQRAYEYCRAEVYDSHRIPSERRIEQEKREGKYR